MTIKASAKHLYDSSGSSQSVVWAKDPRTKTGWSQTGPDQSREKFQNLGPDQDQEKILNLVTDQDQQKFENLGPIRTRWSVDP